MEEQNIDSNTEQLQEISAIYNKKNSQNDSGALNIQKSPIYYYVQGLQKYAQFSGRATRSEYWWFWLITFGFAILTILLDTLLDIPIVSIYAIYALFSLIPSLSILSRRLHDVGHSGWVILLPFAFLSISFLIIPIIFVIISSIWLFILTTKDSIPGDNKYGPNPKGLQA